MSDIQSKLGDGFAKIQGSIKQGKQKLQEAQVISDLKKSASEARTKRLELVIQLGETVYSQLRKGDYVNPELETFKNDMIELDRTIYQINKTLQEVQQKENGMACNCGNPIQPTDKFCGSCGERIEQLAKLNEEEMVRCRTCEEPVPIGASFCASCGLKME
ncbi:zinc ribbon domain-containing protein [Fictibacillus sp. Mic-4]|uniref:zinc ribbon domain-containing protein n=1 Tax=Fictibacillus sp. Mic-4 TaxID=3132826 RepID=UPI003CFB6F0E